MSSNGRRHDTQHIIHSAVVRVEWRVRDTRHYSRKESDSSDSFPGKRWKPRERERKWDRRIHGDSSRSAQLPALEYCSLSSVLNLITLSIWLFEPMGMAILYATRTFEEYKAMSALGSLSTDTAPRLVIRVLSSIEPLIAEMSDTSLELLQLLILARVPQADRLIVWGRCQQRPVGREPHRIHWGWIWKSSFLWIKPAKYLLLNAAQSQPSHIIGFDSARLLLLSHMRERLVGDCIDLCHEKNSNRCLM